jgi:hypothetical protein
MLQLVAQHACQSANPLARQRANRILRIRYKITSRPQPRPDPVWLSAHAM